MKVSEAQRQMDEAVARQAAVKWAYIEEKISIQGECRDSVEKAEDYRDEMLAALKTKHDAAMKIAKAAVAKAGRVVQSASLEASKARAAKAAEEAEKESQRAAAQADGKEGQVAE